MHTPLESQSYIPHRPLLLTDQAASARRTDPSTGATNAAAGDSKGANGNGEETGSETDNEGESESGDEEESEEVSLVTQMKSSITQMSTVIHRRAATHSVGMYTHPWRVHRRVSDARPTCVCACVCTYVCVCVVVTCKGRGE